MWNGSWPVLLGITSIVALVAVMQYAEYRFKRSAYFLREILGELEGPVLDSRDDDSTHFRNGL